MTRAARTGLALVVALVLALTGLTSAQAAQGAPGRIRLASHVIGKSVDGRPIVPDWSSLTESRSIPAGDGSILPTLPGTVFDGSTSRPD